MSSSSSSSVVVSFKTCIDLSSSSAADDVEAPRLIRLLRFFANEVVDDGAEDDAAEQLQRNEDVKEDDRGGSPSGLPPCRLHSNSSKRHFIVALFYENVWGGMGSMR